MVDGFCDECCERSDSVVDRFCSSCLRKRLGVDSLSIPLNQFDEFKCITTEMFDLHSRKHADYGSSQGIVDLGERGLFVRIYDKTCRLRSLVWDSNERKVVDESVDDTLLDLANYAVMCLIVRRGKWGK